jgi:hypothetical protein
MLARVDVAGILIDEKPRICLKAIKGEDPGKPFSLANVYTARSWIDRAEAERMLDVYLGALAIKNTVYKWKRPDFVCWPTTITASAVEGVGP